MPAPSETQTVCSLLPSGTERVVLPRMSSTRLLPSAARLFTGLIGFYQRFVSTALALLSGSGCRFYPTCSEYARLAIAEHGALRGSQMALLRLCRCHPFHPGGYDPPHR